MIDSFGFFFFNYLHPSGTKKFKMYFLSYITKHTDD